MTISVSNMAGMARRRLLALILLISMAAFGSITARAADLVIGSVLAIRGEVSREILGSRTPLSRNAAIYLGDTIVADAGKAKITLTDGTIVSIGEHSRVRLTHRQNAVTRFYLVSGVLRLFIAKITAGGQFEIETETAIAAVRGTDWLIEVVADRTSVAIVTGSVAVTSREAGATVLLDEPGEGTDVRMGRAPTPPRKWPQQRFDTLLARATFE